MGWFDVRGSWRQLRIFEQEGRFGESEERQFGNVPSLCGGTAVIVCCATLLSEQVCR